MIINTCKICKKTFTRPNNPNRVFKYCSTKCMGEDKEKGILHSLRMKGKKAWNKGLKGLQFWHNISGLSSNGDVPWNKDKKCPQLSGKNNGNWQGGKSFEPYGLEFNEDLKEVIRNRDRRKCFICEMTELENKRKLSVHHIDYDKQNNNPNNLISLCVNCHSRTNYNRKKWLNYFKQHQRSIRRIFKQLK